MLIEFSVENYKCFATQQTLNMRPDLDIHALDENLIRTGLTQENGEELVLLPTVAIYGANASGKSNLLEAIYPAVFLDDQSYSSTHKLKNLTSGSFFNNNEETNVSFSQVYTERNTLNPEDFFCTTCKLSASNDYPAKSPAAQVVSSNEDIEKNYWFAGSGVYVSAHVSLFKTEHSNKTILKTSDSQKKSGFFNERKIYEEDKAFTYFCRTYYFLNDILKQSLPNEIGVFESKHDEPIPLMATLDDPERKEKLKQLLRKADFNIEDITAHKAQSGKNKTLYTLEFKIKGQEETLWYNDQSEGTKRFLLMMPTIVHVLETGAILLADELEQHLHPDLCKEVVKLFNNPETNPHGSQLILTTHNQDLMNSKLMRPDQIYFINKDDKTGASTLCRASDFKKIDWNNRKYKVDSLYNDGVFDAKPHTYGLE
jgi:AAA15 family ATPase/GTPase